MVLSPVQYLEKFAPPPPQNETGVHGESKPIDFIDLKTQQDLIRPELEAGIHRVLHHGQYIMGPEVRKLEEKLAGFTGSAHAITCASGTMGTAGLFSPLVCGPNFIKIDLAAQPHNRILTRNVNDKIPGRCKY